jgi:hypothetical protein
MPSGIPPDVTVVVNIVGSNSTMSADSNDTRRRFLWGFCSFAIAPSGVDWVTQGTRAQWVMWW